MFCHFYNTLDSTQINGVCHCIWTIELNVICDMHFSIQNTVSICVPLFNREFQRFHHIVPDAFKEFIITSVFPLSVNSENRTKFSVAGWNHIPSAFSQTFSCTERHASIIIQFYVKLYITHCNFKFWEQICNSSCIVPYMVNISLSASNVIANTFPSKEIAIFNTEAAMALH